jgi:hypothetical protein
MATEVVAGYVGKRRPSWAPVLVLGGELLEVLRATETLKPDDRDVARLWCNYTDPRRGPVTCFGFELRAGMKRSGRRIYETHRQKDGAWSHGPLWAWAQTPELLGLLRQSVELGAERVARFAGRPHEEMTIGGLYTGTCSICGRPLSDAVSLQRGIGPECWGNFAPMRALVQRMEATA